VDEHGEPVAGAEVAVDASPELTDETDLRLFDVEQRLAAAPRFHSAADGRVFLPLGTAVALVTARSGERFGCDVLQFDRPDLGVPVLRIAPDRNLHFTVRGPRGEPCPGVPVVIRWQRGEGRVEPGEATLQLPGSDAGGAVAVWHAQTLDFWPGAEPILCVSALVMGESPPVVRTSLLRPAPDITIPCPPHGGLRVRGWLAPGVPGSEPICVSLWELWDGGACRREVHLREARGAECLLFPVALHRRWRVAVPHLGTREGEGPAWDGEEIAFDLLPDDSSHLVSVVVLLPDGLTCANRTLCVEGWSNRSPTTDADGRLVLPMPCCDQEIALSIEDLASRGQASVTVPACAGPTAMDLGAVRLELPQAEGPQPIVAAGTVVAADTGGPVRARIFAFERVSGRRFETQAAADGTFTVRATCTGELQIVACANGYRMLRVPHAEAYDLLHLALEPAANLRVTVLIDDDVPVECLNVVLRVGDRISQPCLARQPGRIECRLEVNGEEDQVLEVHDGAFLSTSQEDNTKPMPLARLLPQEWQAQGGPATVDLCGRLDVFSVRVTTAEHAEVAANLHFRVAACQDWMQWRARPWIVMPRCTALEAIAVPQQGRFVRRWLVPGRNELVVGEPARVHLSVPGLPEDWRVSVRILQLARREPSLDDLHASCDLPWPADEVAADSLFRWRGWWQAEIVGGTSELEVPECGSYIAMPVVEVDESSVPCAGAAVPVEVLAPGGDLEATIHIDPNRVRKALH
jgi:hypothetical protein